MRSRKPNFLDKFITLRSIHRSNIHIKLGQKGNFAWNSDKKVAS